MKYKHMLLIKDAIETWVKSKDKVAIKMSDIVCAASRFNWEVFMLSKVEGNTISFMARELGYLTFDQITEALMRITSIDGSGIKGSGVSRD